jgi:hypothetical protein
VSRPWSIHPDDEERVATDMSRAIEALASEAGVRPPVDFADRVMAAIATEPLPQPVRAFGVALLAGGLNAAAASVGDAWRVVGGGLTPLAVRVQALALVLALTVASLAVAGGATVGAIGLLTTSSPARADHDDAVSGRARSERSCAEPLAERGHRPPRVAGCVSDGRTDRDAGDNRDARRSTQHRWAADIHAAADGNGRSRRRLGR